MDVVDTKILLSRFEHNETFMAGKKPAWRTRKFEIRAGLGGWRTLLSPCPILTTYARSRSFGSSPRSRNPGATQPNICERSKCKENEMNSFKRFLMLKTWGQAWWCTIPFEVVKKIYTLLTRGGDSKSGAYRRSCLLLFCSFSSFEHVAYQFSSFEYFTNFLHMQARFASFFLVLCGAQRLKAFGRP